MSHVRDITTTAGERFTYNESLQLLALMYKRFGKDITATGKAWRRMLQNSATPQDIVDMWLDARNRGYINE